MEVIEERLAARESRRVVLVRHRDPVHEGLDRSCILLGVQLLQTPAARRPTLPRSDQASWPAGPRPAAAAPRLREVAPVRVAVSDLSALHAREKPVRGGVDEELGGGAGYARRVGALRGRRLGAGRGEDAPREQRLE
jgi:hypothetical protein